MHDNQCAIILLPFLGKVTAGLPLSPLNLPCVDHLEPDKKLPLGSEEGNGQASKRNQSISALAAH